MAIGRPLHHTKAVMSPVSRVIAKEKLTALSGTLCVVYEGYH
jgi:hypothetical protein